jgi:hypothetical protein
MGVQSRIRRHLTRGEKVNLLRQNRRAILTWMLCAVGLFHPLVGHAARSVQVLCMEYDGRLHIETADAGSPGDCLGGGPATAAKDVPPASVRPAVPASCERCIDLSLSCLDNDRPLSTRGERVRSADTAAWSQGDRHPGAAAVDVSLSPPAVREHPVPRPSYDSSCTVLQI